MADKNEQPGAVSTEVEALDVDCSVIVTLKEWLILQRALDKVSCNDLVHTMPFNGATNIFISNPEIYELRRRLTAVIDGIAAQTAGRRQVVTS